jgi:hypothetical protein
MVRLTLRQALDGLRGDTHRAGPDPALVEPASGAPAPDRALINVKQLGDMSPAEQRLRHGSLHGKVRQVCGVPTCR